MMTSSILYHHMIGFQMIYDICTTHDKDRLKKKDICSCIFFSLYIYYLLVLNDVLIIIQCPPSHLISTTTASHLLPYLVLSLGSLCRINSSICFIASSSMIPGLCSSLSSGDLSLMRFHFFHMYS